MRVQSYRLAGRGVPYHVADNQAQMSGPDADLLLWLYGLAVRPVGGGRPEEHSQPAGEIVEAEEQPIPPGDTLEIGVWYGGSLFFAAHRARLRGHRAWGLDQFGRPGAKFADEPTLEVAFAHLRAEDLHRHCVLVPGDSLCAAQLASGTFAAVFSGADHSGRWAIHDMALAQRLVAPGGIVAVHAMHGSPESPSDRYDAPALNAPDGRPYERVVRDCAAEHGWTLLRRLQGSSVEVYRKP